MSNIYTTMQGDMWDGIAYKALGSTDMTDRLMRANPQHIHRFTFPAGVELVLPEVDDTVGSDTIPPWRRSEG